jgi:pantothenate kinase-related protein Tda10
MTQGVAFRPSDEQRRTVKAMAGFGVPHDGIAIMLEIDPKTLRKYFQSELDRGSVEATAKVAQSLFHMATVDKNVAAAIFWMKARAGWREKHELVLSAKIAGEMTDDELMEEIARARAARLTIDGD